MTQRATERPQGFRKPTHWSEAPAPKPRNGERETDHLSPTRYGDWVKNGIAIDF